jgi:6-phosphogluconolactonase
MVREAMLDVLPLPDSNVHPIPTSDPDPAASAMDYERTLRSYFGNGSPRFDLVLLGIGGDGHTASLFPDSPALDERERWVR